MTSSMMTSYRMITVLMMMMVATVHAEVVKDWTITEEGPMEHNISTLQSDVYQLRHAIASLHRLLAELEPRIRSTIRSDETKPKNCDEIKHHNGTSTSGVFTIYPTTSSNITSYAEDGVQVYCDMETEGGGWIVLQNRHNGSVDFDRTYEEYVNGFGEMNGEFWFGLENIHQLSDDGGHYDLRFDIEDFRQHKYNASYSLFYEAKVEQGSETSYISYMNYTSYTGNAGNNIQPLKFYAHHSEADIDEGVCTPTSGGWWGTTAFFGRCDRTNLNGRFVADPNNLQDGDMQWTGEYQRAVKKSQIKFRPSPHRS